MSLVSSLHVPSFFLPSVIGPVTEVERLLESVEKLHSKGAFWTHTRGWIKSMLIPILQGPHETEAVAAS